MTSVRVVGRRAVVTPLSLGPNEGSGHHGATGGAENGGGARPTAPGDETARHVIKICAGTDFPRGSDCGAGRAGRGAGVDLPSPVDATLAAPFRSGDEIVRAVRLVTPDDGDGGRQVDGAGSTE